MDETSIYNYKLLTESLASSGQPTEDELIFIVNAGYNVVINLGLHDSEYSVNNEPSFFKDNSVTYIHIPVVFEEPKTTELESFIKAIEKHKESKVFIHCAANYRASAFIALYRILTLNWDTEKALKEMNTIWLPNDTWQSFISQQLTT